MTDRSDREYVGEHYVYRLFDEFGELIYVGMTRDLNERMRHHRSAFINPWAPYVDSVTSETHPDRVTARAAEQAAIAETCPPFNTNHSARRGVDAEDYKRRWAEKQPPLTQEQIEFRAWMFGTHLSPT